MDAHPARVVMDTAQRIIGNEQTRKQAESQISIRNAYYNCFNGCIRMDN